MYETTRYVLTTFILLSIPLAMEEEGIDAVAEGGYLGDVQEMFARLGFQVDREVFQQ